MADGDRERGLYAKYTVRKLVRVERKPAEDGLPAKYATTLISVDPCFVLEYATDPHARAALAAYADSCETNYPLLAADLRAELEKDWPNDQD